MHANPIEHEPLKSVYLDKDDDIIEDLHDVDPPEVVHANWVKTSGTKVCRVCSLQ